MKPKLLPQTVLLAGAFAMGCLFSHAQVRHDVTMSGVSFNPEDLTINVGDTVHWINDTGINHNVNGSTATFPSNPESFGNDVSTDWEYTFIFTQSGDYDYQCDVHSGAGMAGTVTVQSPSALSSAEGSANGVKVYPNPSRDFIVLDYAKNQKLKDRNVTLWLFDATGKQAAAEFTTRQNQLTVDVQSLPPGVYVYYLTNQNGVQSSGEVIVE